MIQFAPLVELLLPFIQKVGVKVGPRLVNIATKFISIANTYLPKVIETVETVSRVADVIKPKETSEELGAKAMQADKRPEDFEKHNEYIDYLRNDVSVDMEQLSQKELDISARKVLGASIMFCGLEENINNKVSIPFLKSISSTTLDANVILETIKLYSESHLNADALENYLEGTLDIDELDQHSELLVKAHQNAKPELKIEDAEDAVMNIGHLAIASA